MKNDIKKLRTLLKAKSAKLAKLRDELRELQDDVETFAGSAETACEALDQCIDELSQYV